MPFPLLPSLWIARLAGRLSQVLGLGGGTTLPGQILLTLRPQGAGELAARLERGVILISATNGKTTTARILTALLNRGGWQPLPNRAGANLLPGLTTALLAQSDLWGRPRGRSAVLEVDEGHLPLAVDHLSPRLVLLHNLMRDQMDRYGEVDRVARGWRAAVRRLPSGSTLVLNADDPLLAGLAEGGTQIWLYGLEPGPQIDVGAADARFCPRCGTPVSYLHRHYGHLGHYRCDACGFARPEPQVRGEVQLRGMEGSRLRVRHPGGVFEVQVPLPGLYNAVNALAAVAAALALGVPPGAIQAGFRRVRPAFGRMERIQAGDRTLQIALIKNPLGANQVLALLGELEAPAPFLLALNDRTADGTDVSWIWDADFERLAPVLERAVVGGDRAHDLALRLKYAGIPPQRLRVIPGPIEGALDAALEATRPGQVCYVLPTYTALLDLYRVLARRGWAPAFWEQ